MMARPLGKSEQRLLEKVGLRISVDGDVIDLVKRNSPPGEAVAHSLRWQTGPMLDPPEPFLFGRRDQFAVANQASCRVGMIGVKTKDGRHGFSTPNALSVGLR